jgi:5'-nucleotidase
MSGPPDGWSVLACPVEDSLRRTRLSVAVLTVAAAAVVGLPTAASANPDDPAEPAAPAADVPVQLLTMNDFHGRISETTGGDSLLFVNDGGVGPDGKPGTPDDGSITVGGSANIATTIREAKAAFAGAGGTEQSSLFVGAGDLISASPFNSSVFKDEPTIEVLDTMGLDASSVGNHEFDRGTTELKRISAATDGYEAAHGGAVTACQGVTPGKDGCWTDSTGQLFDGADFDYLAANVVSRSTGDPLLPPYQVFDAGSGKKIALIGVVTETTPTIVSPAGIADVQFLDEADAVNRWVPQLQAQGIQAIGVLVHEGGSNTGADSRDRNGCAQLTGPIVDINARVSPAVDLIVSAHSHQAYDCLLADPAGNPRLVTQAGYYGRLVNDIRLTIDGTTGDVERFCAAYTAANVSVTRSKPDPAVAAVVKYWNDKSAEAGNRVVGSATADVPRAGSYQDTDNDPATPPVFVENRGGESSLGNLVAQAQLEGARNDPSQLQPVIAFMNPGGLRTDLAGGEVTYSELYNIQPFGNTVNSTTLDGADIRAVLEQQFQAAIPGTSPAAGNGPRNSTLVLGTSAGFSYSYDLSQPYGQRIDPASIALDGRPIVAGQSYRVVMNSFLATGGDSFTAFTRGTSAATGPVDVDTAVAYFQAHSPVAPPTSDHGKATTFTAPPAPATGLGGGTATPPPVTSLPGATAVAGPGRVGPNCDAAAVISDDTPFRGNRVTVTGTKFAAGEEVTFTLDTGAVLGTASADDAGTVTVTPRVPVTLPAGTYTVTLTGAATGETASDTFRLDPLWLEILTRLREMFHR